MFMSMGCGKAWLKGEDIKLILLSRMMYLLHGQSCSFNVIKSAKLA